MSKSPNETPCPLPSGPKYPFVGPDGKLGRGWIDEQTLRWAVSNEMEIDPTTISITLETGPKNSQYWKVTIQGVQS